MPHANPLQTQTIVYNNNNKLKIRRTQRNVVAMGTETRAMSMWKGNRVWATIRNIIRRSNIYLYNDSAIRNPRTRNCQLWCILPERASNYTENRKETMITSIQTFYRVKNTHESTFYTKTCCVHFFSLQRNEKLGNSRQRAVTPQVFLQRLFIIPWGSQKCQSFYSNYSYILLRKRR